MCDRDSLIREHTISDKCAIAGQVVTRVIDSGASFHVMNPEEMTNQQRKKIYSIKPLQISTANGRIAITKAADLWIDKLGCKLTFLIMPDAPCLISLGLLVRDNAFTFSWVGERCILAKNGKDLECEIRGNVPHLTMVVQKADVDAPEVADGSKVTPSKTGDSQGDPESTTPQPVASKNGSSQDDGSGAQSQSSPIKPP